MADPADVMKRWFRAIDQNDVEGHCRSAARTWSG